MADSPLDDHFHNPRNTGLIERPDATSRVENPVCGDLMHLYLRLGSGGVVEEARFQVYGCPAAIAAGSVLTELIRGRRLEEIRRLQESSIDRALGGLGGEKAHAAVLAIDALRTALAGLTTSGKRP